MYIKAIITLIYGIVIAGGGVAGYVAADSLPSLISGGVLGIIIIAGSIMMFMGVAVGQGVAIFATLFVAGFFGFKLVKAMSAGESLTRAAVLVALSLIELAVLFAVKNK
ncbi:MAG: hypothetical protein KKG33_14100 [candidate division Zixibacteria bacterium]|nr:hypothetical protein [candidate division Zixibacteria bacterium]MBU1470673.1 hypothetical protein [candidate division Zixibacteria bacterium]MBU2626685.1 hypothetical protein [candidate division Zixibacteria bacterium]